MTLTEFVQAQNIKIDAFFLGKKKDENGWEHFEWRVDLVNMQGRHIRDEYSHDAYSRIHCPTLTVEEMKACPRHSITYKMGMAHQGFFNSETKQWRFATSKEIKSFFIWKESNREPKPIPPTVTDVLSNVQMTCLSLHNSPLWLDWCNECGINPDSIKEKELYERCVKEYQDFRKFFGNKFQEFLECENDA